MMMLQVKVLIIAIVITVGWCSSVCSKNPDMFVAEGNKNPGRVLSHHEGALHGQFHRSLSNNKLFRTEIGSIEYLSSDEFFLCSGEDSALIRRSQIGEEVFYLSPNIVRQVRSTPGGVIWWSEQTLPNGDHSEASGDSSSAGSIYRWDAVSKKPKLVCHLSKTLLEGEWKGAFDVRNDKVYVAVSGDSTKIYEIDDPQKYKLVLTSPINIRNFRWDDGGKLWATDEKGRIVVITNFKATYRFEVVIAGQAQLVDFDFKDVP
jgi:hypothetical protein